jgi:hypothetical protein
LLVYNVVRNYSTALDDWRLGHSGDVLLSALANQERV